MGFSDLLRVRISRKIEFFSQKNIKFSRKPIKIEFFPYIAKSTFFSNTCIFSQILIFLKFKMADSLDELRDMNLII